jgi:hypothetical protein
MNGDVPVDDDDVSQLPELLAHLVKAAEVLLELANALQRLFPR